MMTKNQELGELYKQLPPWAPLLVRAFIAEHSTTCPVRERVQRIEVRFGFLIGYMIGSGLIGGVAGSLIIKAICGT